MRIEYTERIRERLGAKQFDGVPLGLPRGGRVPCAASIDRDDRPPLVSRRVVGCSGMTQVMAEVAQWRQPSMLLLERRESVRDIGVHSRAERTGSDGSRQYVDQPLVKQCS